MARTQLRLEALERRDTPAAFHDFSGSTLKIWFDGERVPSASPGNAQAVQVSSYLGKVTLNDQLLNDHQGQPVSPAQVKEILVDGSGQPNFIDLHLVAPGQGFTSSLNGHVTVRGHSGNDVLYGSQFDDRIRGGDGFDQIAGGAGDDWMAGDAGDDWIDGGDGNNIYQGGSGRDFFARFHTGDRVVDFTPQVDFYDPIGVSPGDIGPDAALLKKLRDAQWNLGDEVDITSVQAPVQSIRAADLPVPS
jgi:Ca2+-binding RTX toxin-like protein